jgi:hypothetical protein
LGKLFPEPKKQKRPGGPGRFAWSLLLRLT